VNLIPEIRADVLQKSIARAHKQNILLPTFAQQKDPTLVPDARQTCFESPGRTSQSNTAVDSVKVTGSSFHRS